MPPKKRLKASMSAEEALREIQADDYSDDEDFSQMEISDSEDETTATPEETRGNAPQESRTGRPNNVFFSM